MEIDKQAVLISPLGLSPGAVSGVFFELKLAYYIDVQRIVTIGPDDQENEPLRESLSILNDIFRGRVEHRWLPLVGIDDLSTDAEYRVFQTFADEIRQAKEEGWEVVVAVTGGRSGLGAMAAMAAQFYGADALCHLHVSSDIEEKGRVTSREMDAITQREIPGPGVPGNKVHKRNPYLDPIRAGKGRLVELPFVRLDITPQELTRIARGEVTAFIYDYLRQHPQVLIDLPQDLRHQFWTARLAEKRQTPPREYKEFALHVVQKPDGNFQVEVTTSPAGEACEDISPPFLGSELRDLRDQLSLQSLNHKSITAIRERGKHLFDSLVTASIKSRFLTAWGSIDKKEGLRLRLRLPSNGDLGGLPLRQVTWEILHDRREFLALSWRMPIVRHPEIPEQILETLAVTPPLRILAMRANPPGSTAPVEKAHIDQLCAGLRLLEKEGLAELVVPEGPATLDTLRKHLRSQEIHVFHFVGHGGFDSNLGGKLLFENNDGQKHWVSARQVAQTLCDAPTLRLVVLNACHGAQTPHGDPFVGVAESLMEGGLQAIIAHQGPISIQAALVLTYEFYASLALGFPIEACLAEARKAINGKGDFFEPTMEWALPVLFMRSRDGQLFDITPGRATSAGGKR